MLTCIVLFKTVCKFLIENLKLIIKQEKNIKEKKTALVL